MGPTEPVPPRDDSPLQTEKLTYQLRRLPNEFSTSVTATYINAGNAPIHFARCNAYSDGPLFEIRRTGRDSTRSFFTDWAWACVGGVPTGVLLPGQTLTIRSRFGSVDQPTMQPPLKPAELIGLFRIYLRLCTRHETDSDSCEVSPDRERRSNAFLVHY